jgi:hypothetical protein
MDIRYLIKDFFKSKNLQDFINRRYKDERNIILPHYCLDFIVTKDQIKFKIGSDVFDDLPFICEILKDYDFSDIRKNDIVIDIGANIGSFALRAAQMGCKVLAVEPIRAKFLKENILLNNVKIEVLEGALGDGSKKIISWGRIEKEVQSYSLIQLKEIAGGCDFLKLDCEGAEWLLRPDDLFGIRRIEAEFHYFNHLKINNSFLRALQGKYIIKKDLDKRNAIEIVHMYAK